MAGVLILVILAADAVRNEHRSSLPFFSLPTICVFGILLVLGALALRTVMADMSPVAQIGALVIGNLIGGILLYMFLTVFIFGLLWG